MAREHGYCIVTTSNPRGGGSGLHERVRQRQVEEADVVSYVHSHHMSRASSSVLTSGVEEAFKLALDVSPLHDPCASSTYIHSSNSSRRSCEWSYHWHDRIFKFYRLIHHAARRDVTLDAALMRCPSAAWYLQHDAEQLYAYQVCSVLNSYVGVLDTGRTGRSLMRHAKHSIR